MVWNEYRTEGECMSELNTVPNDRNQDFRLFYPEFVWNGVDDDIAPSCHIIYHPWCDWMLYAPHMLNRPIARIYFGNSLCKTAESTANPNKRQAKKMKKKKWTKCVKRKAYQFESIITRIWWLQSCSRRGSIAQHFFSYSNAYKLIQMRLGHIGYYE